MTNRPDLPQNQKPLSADLDGDAPQDVLVVKNVGEKRKLGDWLIVAGIPGIIALIGIVALFMWLRGTPPDKVEPRPTVPETVAATPAPDAAVPGTVTPVAPPAGTTAAGLPSTSTPAAGTTVPATTSGGGSTAAVSGTGVWAGFRGGKRDGISTETNLARSWGASGPRKLWSASMGEGHAGAAVYKGRVYVLDYDAGARKDVLRCLNLSDGKQLWTTGYAADIKRNHGMSRTVPATDGKFVVTLGPLGMVMCCDANSGKLLWQKDLVKEYGTVIPEWYAGQCPLIENNNAIIAPGDKSIMIAIHLPTGKVSWTAPNPRGWQMTHCSITPISYGGKRLYVYPASGGVVGVNGSDGKILWDYDGWTVNTSNIPAPVDCGKGRIFLCGGYNSGAMMLQMNGSATAVSKVFRLSPNTFQSHQQTPILYKDHLYGVKVGGALVCMDLKGKVVWTSSGKAQFGLGPYTLANGLLYVLGDTGTLALVEATPAGYKELSKAQILSGGDAWAPLALVDGKLIARDLTTMVCLDVSG